MHIRALTTAILVTLSISPTGLPAQAQGASPTGPDMAENAMLRPICADPEARAKLVAQMQQGGEYERATSKWNTDVACEQLALPANPTHDTADLSNDASHTSWIFDARWSPDGKLIATASADGSVRLWDVATGKPVRKIDISKLTPLMKTNRPTYVRWVRFVGDGRSLVVAADVHPVRIFDVGDTERERFEEVSYTDPKGVFAPAIETTASGLLVMWGSGEGDLVAYDTKAKAERFRLSIPKDMSRFAVSEAGGFLATTVPGKNRSVLVQLRKLGTGEVIWETEVEGSGSAASMAFSRDGKRLGVAVRGHIHVYATADKKLINKVLVYPSFEAFSFAFTADGQKLIATAFRHPQLWDIATGRRIRHFGPFRDGASSVDVSPDGRYLVTGHARRADGRIWDIGTGTFHRRLGKNTWTPG